jgi:hypothetical protein
MSAISPNMMGSSKRRNGSLKDLLTDRGLESKMQFDVTAESEAMPDLADLARASAAADAADMGIDDSSLSGEEASAPELVALPPAWNGSEEPIHNLLSTSPNIRDEKASVCRKAFGSWSLTGIYCWWPEIYISPFSIVLTHGLVVY